ncbi:MAG: VCBS repeat-containing protein [Candidatus Latescibacterota bacterium]
MCRALGTITLCLTAVTAPGQQYPAVRFVDVTSAAGIDFRYINGASGRKYMTEAVGSGAAFFDADGDGALDLYIVNGATLPGYGGPVGPNVLFHNDGDDTFTDVTATSRSGDVGFGMAAAVGDMDNDGDADLYVGNFGPNVLYRNDGTGIFADITAAAAFVDYDRDGDLGLYIANMAFSTDANRECFGGQSRSYCGPTTYPGQSGVLYRNEGDADSPAFVDVTVAAGLFTDTGRQLAAVFCERRR